MKYDIIVTNQSSVVSDAEVKVACDALQIQISRDFAPLWGVDATVKFAGPQSLDVPGAWQVYVLDNADQADALGYHDFTAAGMPIGKVFAKTSKDDGASWTVCLSHEVLEMLGDPDIVRAVFVQDGPATGVMYAYEVCDAVEADSLGYEINGVLLSDFVTPAWFEPPRPGAQLSFRKSVHSPYELAPGGYISYFRVPNKVGWEQRFADSAAAARSKQGPNGDARHHRHARRGTPMASRVLSTGSVASPGALLARLAKPEDEPVVADLHDENA